MTGAPLIAIVAAHCLLGAPTLYFDCLENLWRRPCRYMQVPYYNVHKIMQGMLDQYTLLHDAEALEVSREPPHASHIDQQSRKLHSRSSSKVHQSAGHQANPGNQPVIKRSHPVCQ